MDLYVLDTRDVWHGPLIEAARARGWSARRIFRGAEVDGEGFGFIRTHADPAELARNRDEDDPAMRSRLTMFQDRAQVEVYENETEQWRRWGRWMPETWLVRSIEELESLDLPFPLVSKANEGASSVNVRILDDRDALMRHAAEVFGPGIPVKCCAGRAMVTQRDYLLLQRFIPHRVTWRVNIVGAQLAIFMRYCYRDRPVAQTGNVEPVKTLDSETESLLAYASDLFDALGTKWCAVDILRDGDGSWKLLETSLAWPWPSPGDCNNGIFFARGKFEPGRRWIEMMDLLIEQAEAGVWASA